MGARVAAESVSKSYLPGPGASPVDALLDVSLVLEPGTFTALLGPSGCGKSTLLNLLGALDRPTAGRVLVDGRDLATLGDDERDAYRRKTAATVFQFFNLLPTMNALENVALPLLLDGAAPGAADARAAALLADEPTGNLDSKTGTQVLDLVSALVADKGITVVMATHSTHAAARASRVLHLLDGRLVP